MTPIIRLYGFSFSEASKKLLDDKVNKLKTRLRSFGPELVSLSIVMKKHEKHSFFSGQIALSLPKKNLVITHGGSSDSDWLHGAFDKLIKEFEKYKGKHFTSVSTYADRATIRKDSML